MAILQQQRQHQQGGVAGGGNSKPSPSHLGGGLSKQPMVDPLSHPGMGGALSDLHAKTQGMYSGESNRVNGCVLSNMLNCINIEVECLKFYCLILDLFVWLL